MPIEWIDFLPLYRPVYIISLDIIVNLYTSDSFKLFAVTCVLGLSLEDLNATDILEI